MIIAPLSLGGDSMAVTFICKCPDCGQNHQFCFPDRNARAGDAICDYVCPITQNANRVNAPDGQRENRRTCPTGTVIVREAHIGF